MEAELDVLCLVNDLEKKRIIKEFLEQDTRPLLASQVAEPHRSTFNVLDNLPTVETSKFVGEDGLALSWFLGGGDWFTETELTLKDLAKAGAEQSAAILWVDGRIETVFKVMDQSNIKILTDIDEDLWNQRANGENQERGVFDFLLGVLRR